MQPQDLNAYAWTREQVSLLPHQCGGLYPGYSQSGETSLDEIIDRAYTLELYKREQMSNDDILLLQAVKELQGQLKKSQPDASTKIEESVVNRSE